MLIAHDFKAIFIHVHRTGGTTISNLLWQKAGKGMEEVAAHGNFRSREKEFLFQYEDYFKFGFVRNPWDRLLSWYTLLQKGRNEPIQQESKHFEKYLESLLVHSIGLDEHFHANQLDFFSDEKGEILVDRIGRYEHFEKDLKDIFRVIGLSGDQIPWVNETAPRDYSLYYTEKGRYLVEKYCKRDIEYFGYQFSRSLT